MLLHRVAAVGSGPIGDGTNATVWVNFPAVLQMIAKCAVNAGEVATVNKGDVKALAAEEGYSSVSSAASSPPSSPKNSDSSCMSYFFATSASVVVRWA